MKQYTNCPLCGGKEFKNVLECKDYTVSQEVFTLSKCSDCDLLFTNPIPDLGDLGSYYKSEDYISHSDTRKGIVSRLYHLVRRFTLKRKLDIVSHYVSRGTLLDYGAGTGMFLSEAANAGWTVYGVEPDGGARNLANKKGVSVASDLSGLNVLHSGRYDAITLWHVLEHVVDLEDTLNYFRDSLSKTGVLIIALPNHTSFDSRFYNKYWAAYDVPRHLYHFEPRTIIALLSKFGFSLQKMLPMKFDSFYVSLLSERYKTGKTNLFKAFWTGLQSNLKAKDASQYSSVIYIFKLNQ